MNRVCSIIFIVLFSTLTADAQGWQWGRGSIGNNTSSWPVATDQHGNAYVAGVSSGSVSFNSFLPPFKSEGDLCLLAKYDTYGDFLWVRSAQNGSHTYPLDIATDASGNCFLLGSSPDADIKIGGHTLHNAVWPGIQYFVAKFDSLGYVSWISPAGSHTGPVSTLTLLIDSLSGATIRREGSITVDADGNLYVAVPFNALTISVGTTTLTNANNDPFALTDDILVAKYDVAGNVLWATSSGGNRTEVPTGITLTPKGTVYVSGIFNSNTIQVGTSLVTNTAPQRWNGIIAKYSSSGIPLWAGAIKGAGNCYAAGLTSDTANNVYLVGGSTGNSVSIADTVISAPYPGISYAWLLKLDAADSVRWYTTIASPSGGVTCGYSVATLPAGNIWISGSFTNEIVINDHIFDRTIGIPENSVDPVFIAEFEPSKGINQHNGVLQSGGSHQSDLACTPQGVYLCSDYKYPCWPFVVGDNVLPKPYIDQSWLFLAKYTLNPVGPGTGPGSYATPIDTTVCLKGGNEVILKAPKGYLLYHWNDGSSDSVLSITAPGMYWVNSMSPDDASATIAYNVHSNDALCNCDAMMPNAFSPNGDGRNDTYGPVFRDGCEIHKYAFAIYNRWGEQVFYTSDPSVRWDGMYKNEPAEASVYMFYLRYSVNPSYPEYTKKGDMTVVR